MTDFRVFKPLFLDKGYKNRTTTIKVQKCMSEKKAASSCTEKRYGY